MSDALRELHRVIDARIALAFEDRALDLVRGVVTSVGTGTLTARLDGAGVATPGIRVPSHITAVAGASVLVLRRRGDGLLVVLAVL